MRLPLMAVAIAALVSSADPASDVGAAAAQAPATSSETLLVPFHSPPSDARLYWLGEGATVLLADYFEVFGGATVPRESRVAAFERLQLPPAVALSHATVIKVAQLVGAASVVIGAYELAGDELTVRARMIRLDPGHLLPEVVERGSLADLFGIYERLARRLRAATTASPPPPAGSILASSQAFEAYVKGLVAETPDAQRTFLEQAMKLAPRDDRVRLALWQVLNDLGDHTRALEVVNGVTASSRQARQARYLGALSSIELKQYDHAFEMLTTLAGDLRQAEVLNALGVVQLRRGSTAQAGKPTYYFSQAAQTDGSDADYFFNLGYAYFLDRDPPAAIYWLREALRRDPADGDAHYVLGVALQQSGAAAEAARERELARRLSSTYADWDKRAAAGGEPVPRGLERLQEHLERPATRLESLITSSGQRDQASLAAFHLDAGRRAFAREADREAEHELRRVLFLSPYEAEAHLLLGRIYLRGGRAADAVQAFKIALWSHESIEAHLALAEAYLQLPDVGAAKAEVDRALALDPASADALALRERIARAKM